MIGDLQQLAPVVKDDDWNLLRDYYDTPFFFGSRALRDAGYVSIELKEVFRQSDGHFISILNQVRENRLDAHATDVNFDAELRKVRQKLSHLRPLDFLAESRGGGFRLMVRSISVALAIVVIVALLFVGARYVFVKKGSRDMTVTNGITALQTKPERRYISSKELDKSVAKGSATRPVFFNNGQSFEDYIQSKLVYPAELSKKPIPGKVVVRFTIGSDGVVREVFIVRSTNPAFSREAHKLLYASPKWQPAEVGGVKVATLMMIELNWKK